MRLEKNQIETVSALMNCTFSKAEKYLKELCKDLEEDGPIDWEDVLEVVKMEHNCKVNNIKNVVVSDKTKEKGEKKPKTVKVSDEKSAFFAEIVDFLEKTGKNYEILTENKKISVKINEIEIKLDFVQTRQKKS